LTISLLFLNSVVVDKCNSWVLWHIQSTVILVLFLLVLVVSFRTWRTCKPIERDDIETPLVGR
jgi:hypothetical protein